MKIFKMVLISLISLAALIVAIFFSMGYFKPKPGGIKISTNPSASIYVNGSFVGKSPYQGMYPAGKIYLKLMPETSSMELIPFETNITLVSGIETVITKPDNAQISIDGVSRGFAPYKISAIAPAMHQITVKASGYTDSTITVKTLTGYRLTFFTKLEKETVNVNPTEASPEASLQKTFIQILDTPTGFLRVRTKPGVVGEEIAEVKPGEIYPYIDTDVASGWLEIQYQEPKVGLPTGITGWISGDYSKKIMLPADSTSSANIK